jgi:phosphoribosylanthranilate isomerase
MTVSIKICGLNDEESVQSVIKAGADFAGFVHYAKSPRHISLNVAAQFRELLPDTIKSVMVMVNPSDELLIEMQREIAPDFFQLHGDETKERVIDIRNKFTNTGIIKAIAVQNTDDIKRAKEYNNITDFILFDAKPTENMIHGGNGISFDWSLLTVNEMPENWFLSGGLNTGNVKSAISQTGARFIDVSSGVEQSRGVKSPELIENFIKTARK